ncbi:right-handed parallel beta-helix repeat-containing protein [Alteromonas macleodii]|uniref:right-handed parallel beta-helix repeat-containing protein n=1 Tax=Alteromonas macleodii TaxID=28108 RepID=UPI0029810340|nr:right-handed parallel beta-helix repeat-containing protein [Alteromonas macleodii]MDW5285849.1 right-handed parallel beta-helix repeat-containing protein [Alteromonas macleodii]
MYSANSKPSIFRFAFIGLLSFLMLSCATVNKNDRDYTKGSQPGDILHNYLSANINDNNTVNSLLANYKGPKNLSTVIEKYDDEIAQLYKQKVLSRKPSLSEEAKKTLFANLTSNQASALFALYPIDTAKWMKIISTYSGLSKNDIYESAITAGLDPSIVFAASASGFEDTATPLINSIGLVIYGQDEESTAAVKFRAENDTYWREGLDLSWEPIYGSLAGSIVYLEADTTYHIEVTITDAYGDIVEHSFQTTTKPNTPPIDPNKIYYLSEIYSGGQLDLEALNIEGSADGYAKIIGDGPVIEAGSDVLAAVNIGNNSYVMLENLTVKGGQRYGIFAKKAHHIWIKGCNVSEYGREAVDIRNGVAYSSTTNNSPINYDSGIYLERSGIAVIEECEVHSPNLGANSWAVGHPKGANALQVWAYHDSDAYRGEFIVRNNHFYGTPSHRFNDVIEGRMNFERRGGFVRNSAIYGNYLAYANDDLIEIDGGQQNVLVYGNEMEQGYAGISIAPNMLGPSYIFHNFIHDLGDERGKEWAAIKAGGLVSKPAGKTFIFENIIFTNRNGIASSNVASDSTYWVEMKNNIIVNRYQNNLVGLGIYDKEKYYKSAYLNNVIYNKSAGSDLVEVSPERYIPHPLNHDNEFTDYLSLSETLLLPIDSEDIIPNFSRTFEGNATNNTREISYVEFNIETLSKFANQTKYGSPLLVDNTTMFLEGNLWFKMPIDYDFTIKTVVELTFQLEGGAEIAGIALESDNSVTKRLIFRFAGHQNYGNDFTSPDVDESEKKIRIDVGQFGVEDTKYLVFILDNDVSKSQNNARLTIKDIKIFEDNDVSFSSEFDHQINIGL